MVLSEEIILNFKVNSKISNGIGLLIIINLYFITKCELIPLEHLKAKHTKILALQET